jgi:hypothetical protein
MKFKLTGKKIVFIFCLFFVLLCFLEWHLRSFWGFCDAVLMKESKVYEYIPQPNQNRFRFRNKVKYNSFSMRSDEPDTSAFKILGFGDSVINGGSIIDQDSIATTLLSVELSKIFSKQIQVLNISAGSWGPDNCYAYLKEHGDFGAKMMFLVLSSHDAYDNMDFRKIVDKVKGYDTKQYKSAVWELMDRYLLPKVFENKPHNEKGIVKHAPKFNTGIKDLSDYAKANDIPFFLYLHADTVELNNGVYNANGQEIISFCNDNNIRCVQSLGILDIKDYRDVTHLKASGHRKMEFDIQRILSEYLSDSFKLVKNHAQ